MHRITDRLPRLLWAGLLALLVGLAAQLAPTPAHVAAATALHAPALQATEPIFALPGTLRQARNQPFDNYLVTNDGTIYGVMGETPEIERQLRQYRELGPDVEVKVWGVLYPNGRLSTSPEIIVSDIESDSTLPAQQPTEQEPSAPAAATSPTIIVNVDTANVRAGPGTGYQVVGNLIRNQACPIIGRNGAADWWQIKCGNGLTGWISDEIVISLAVSERIPVISVPPPAVPTPSPNEQPIYAWRTSYFANRDLAGAPFATQDVASIDFNWGSGAPYPGMPGTNWSARFERVINFNPGTYRFTMTVDDGARLFIDNQIVIDDWREGSTRVLTADRSLNGSATIRIEYFQAGGTAQLQLAYGAAPAAPPVTAPSAPPVSVAKGDWEASYFNNPNLGGGPVVVRAEARTPYPLDKNWGGGSPAPGIGGQNWSARFRAVYYFDPGDYMFKVRADDGIRVYIDQIRVIDAWNDGYVETQNKFRGLGAGDHTITVEYYQRGGDSFAQVYWYKDNETGGGGSGGGGGMHFDE